ncbi:TPA: choice-of-anchor D domain-containing protein [Candidatus Poribacteria bacterium]|nr:choice-of-anchor D domain-containing protein [Candidatus Poribacteria bacterium]
MGGICNMQMCPKCSHDNNDTAKFCNMCRTELMGLLGKDEILHSRYRATKVLGYGGFGAVYLAEDTQQNNAFCAVKEMFDNPNWTATERIQNIQSFQDEANLLRSLPHQNLAKVTDVFADGGKQYFVMEFVTGQNLKDIIDKSNVIGGITESQVTGWMIQICDVLEYLHQNNIIHRDIKPDNIRFTPEGQVKLVDFGIAKVFDPRNPDRETDPMKRAATPGYAPLEQYGGGGHTDARSDIHALGATLYHLLTGQCPPDANDRAVQPTIFDPPRNINPNISDNFEQVILKAMAIRQEDRYQTVAEMRDALLGKIASTFPCPKCQTPNPAGSQFCLACQTPFGGVINPFRFQSGKEAQTLSELIALIDQYWDEAKVHLYAGHFANWLSGIGRGDLALEANNISTSVSNQDEGLEQFVQSTGLASPPDLSPSETQLDFGNMFQGEKRDKDIIIRNPGRGYLTGTVSSADAWLKVKTRKFAGNQRHTIAVEIDTKKLSIGAANSSISLKWNGGALTIPVKVDVVERPPVLSVSKTKLDFANIQCGATASRTFEVSNISDGTLQGAVVSNTQNISVSPKNFSVRKGDKPVTIKVTVTAPNQRGKQKETLTIQSSGGVAQIDCEYVVEKPILSVSTTRLDFGTTLKGRKKSRSFTIENSGTGTLQGAISSDSRTVTVSPKSFRTAKSKKT